MPHRKSKPTSERVLRAAKIAKDWEDNEDQRHRECPIIEAAIAAAKLKKPCPRHQPKKRTEYERFLACERRARRKTQAAAAVVYDPATGTASPESPVPQDQDSERKKTNS